MIVAPTPVVQPPVAADEPISVPPPTEEQTEEAPTDSPDEVPPIDYPTQNAEKEKERMEEENKQQEIPAEIVIIKAFCSACTKNLYIGSETDFKINNFIGKACTNKECQAILFYNE